ncbi:cyclodeaminase/cyclohydrolase family protein [Oscillochloris sp. ZM17-4]|uniref:cyclodeaminase/cyclohydrolase family protein n=1 Tax=Oscillochloris sp. ZM17-4 TaxID=2866714 RepID=UPI001C72E6AF|nr:cyclodeaminase/cyclohydrolase family protein [Oscillochloris sp. ZM17-4]MBX0329511.1 cyclodeaminase/cyclohydrolase family protein [Oscillochloris sp. ZM17-4]
MTDTLNGQTIDTFLGALASSAPTPGGGSVAGISGAMSAGLVSMVCALMIGKKQFADIEDEVRGIQDRAEGLRRELQALAQEDIEVFGRLSAAYKLPRTTEADAATRRAAIQKVTRIAAEVPLRTAQAAAALVPLCTSLASRCSRLIVSDIGVATLLAKATVQSAILNVEINLSGLEDTNFVRETRAQIEDLAVGLGEEAEGILEIVRGRINQ